VVDNLFAAGELAAAAAAQREAVPTLGRDVLPVLKHAQIHEKWGDVGTGEGLVNKVRLGLQFMAEQFPVFAAPTRFEGRGRILVVNLEPLNVGGNMNVDRQKTAIAYAVTMHALTADWTAQVGATKADQAALSGLKVGQQYRTYHERRHAAMERRDKVLIGDEIHALVSKNHADADVAMAPFADTARIARHHGIRIILASHTLKEFGRELPQLASGKWIFQAKGEMPDQMAEVLEFPAALVDAARRGKLGKQRSDASGNVRGPLGAFVMDTNGPRIGELVHNQLGADEIWAVSTTPQDVLVRERLAHRIGLLAAIELLAEEHPSGSVKMEIENKQARAQAQWRDVTEDQLIAEEVDRLDQIYRRECERRQRERAARAVDHLESSRVG
jgi:intracellular multiplication protein IcmB